MRVRPKDGGYVVPFHEFAKSAILGSRRFYRSNVSHIVNMFKQSDAIGASHLAASRVLARLCAAEGVASVHGDGFVAVSAIVKEYRLVLHAREKHLDHLPQLVRA